MESTPEPMGLPGQYGLPLAVLLMGIALTAGLVYAIGLSLEAATSTIVTSPQPPETDQLAMTAGAVGTLLSILLAVVSYRLIQGRNRLLSHLQLLSEAREKDRRTLQNKHIEKEVLSQALADSERRTRDYIELGDAFAFELDEQGRIGFLSPQISHWYDEPPTSLARQPLLTLLPDSEQPVFDEALQTCLRERRSQRIETRLVTCNGDSCAVTLSLCPVSDRLNQCQGFRGLGWRRDQSSTED